MAMADDFGREYARRIHRAQDYVERHLAEALTLETIAREACFSPFHFHRIYSAFTGETLYRFIQRLRLERAAALLKQSTMPITEIALASGFGSSAVFARAFRVAYGLSASEYRKKCKTESKNAQSAGKGPDYSVRVNHHQEFRRTPMHNVEAQSIEIRDMSLRTVAYLRHVGPYAGNNALFERLFGELFHWVTPRGLFGPQTEIITIYHDDPDITDEDKLRISVGITVAPGTPTSGRINTLELAAGKYACARFEIDPADYGAAWQAVVGKWLPQSGWQLADGPCYECYLNDPKTHPLGVHIVEIRIPVKPL